MPSSCPLYDLIFSQSGLFSTRPATYRNCCYFLYKITTNIMRRNSAFPFLAPTVVLRVCGGRTSASNTLLVWLKHRADNNKQNIKTRATKLDGSVNMFQAGVTKFLPGISDLQKKGKLELDYLMTLIFRSMMSMWCGFNFSSWEFKSLHHKEPRIKGTRQMDANNCKMKLDLLQKNAMLWLPLRLFLGQTGLQTSIPWSWTSCCFFNFLAQRQQYIAESKL